VVHLRVAGGAFNWNTNRLEGEERRHRTRQVVHEVDGAGPDDPIDVLRHQLPSSGTALVHAPVGERRVQQPAPGRDLGRIHLDERHPVRVRTDGDAEIRVANAVAHVPAARAIDVVIRRERLVVVGNDRDLLVARQQQALELR
jgi:hypothetical protein